MGLFTQQAPTKKYPPQYKIKPDIPCPRCGCEHVLMTRSSGWFSAGCDRCGFGQSSVGQSSGTSETRLMRELHGKYFQYKNDREDAQLLAKQLVNLLKNAKAS